MKHRIEAAVPLTLGALALSCLINIPGAHAQPDINNAPKADNPTNRPAGRQVTPQERARQRLRRELQLVGVNQLAVQDTLIAYIEAENEARLDLGEKGRRLQVALRGNALSDAQVAALLNDYQAAIEEDKARRDKTQAELVKNVDITKMPKVEATLVLMGVYGDGPLLVNNLLPSTRARDTLNLLRRGGNARQGGADAAGGAPRGFGQTAPGATQPRPTQPNIKPKNAPPAEA